MRLGVLFSGGKDSAFAAWKAMGKEEVACLVTVWQLSLLLGWIVTTVALLGWIWSEIGRLDAVATEAGALPLSPDVWEAHDTNTGEVIMICRDTVEAAALVRENRGALIYTLAEIGAILSAYRDITEIKRTFPGSVVRPLGRTRPDPVSVTTGELLPCDIDDEIPF